MKLFRAIGVACLVLCLPAGAVLTADSPKPLHERVDCAVCHLKWVDAFSALAAINLQANDTGGII